MYFGKENKFSKFPKMVISSVMKWVLTARPNILVVFLFPDVAPGLSYVVKGNIVSSGGLYIRQTTQHVCLRVLINND